MCSCNDTKTMTDPENLLKSLVETNKTPAVHYILFNKDSFLTDIYYGYADVANSRKADASTTYHAYSVTKTFTALAIMQLAESKKLDIDHPVKTYLSGFPYNSVITIRQLLAHTAGIPNPIPLNWIHLADEHSDFDKNAFMNAIIGKHSKTKSAPNTKFSYSNLGYMILGSLIEEVSGLSYEQYVSQHIIEKAGINRSELGFEVSNFNNHAKGYQKKNGIVNLLLGFFIDKSKFMGPGEGNWKPFNNFYVNGAAYGGLVGSPYAFVTYLRQLLDPRSRLISEDYKQLLFTENHTIDNQPTGMCLSWFTGYLNGIQYFSHAGGGGGYYCELRIYPDKGMGSAIFFNRTGMTDERYLNKIDAIYFDKLTN